MAAKHRESSGDVPSSEQRFAFGKNWQAFLSVLNDERVSEAERSLREMLGIESLTGKTFLDVGCGSGLFSLAAMRLGAERVHSFDYDPQSVACAQELKRRYFPDVARWTAERGDALNTDYLQGLGQWDIVYSWGVLHHTGNMWQALANVSALVKPGGTLFISIYNDQGRASRVWKSVKRLYNTGKNGQRIVTAVYVPYFVLRDVLSSLLHQTNLINTYRTYKTTRGMSRLHDWHDWLGGYPFEVAKPEEVFALYRARGFNLEVLKTCGSGLGCNEFVLRKQ